MAGYLHINPVSCLYPMRLNDMQKPWPVILMMNSTERHERRYQRRKAKRHRDQTGLFERVISLNSLNKAADESSKGVKWKASVQRYNMTRMTNIYRAHVRLVNGEDIRRGFICFDICERGKLRHIQSVHFSERVVQKALCKYALIPELTRSLVYDNGASQKGKGTHFALKRLETHLRRHYRRHGREGGIVLIDLHDYFGSVDHDKLKEIYRQIFEDARLLNLAFSFIDAFDKGLGLGSEISQISAITYPNRIDHYIKEVLKIKGYGRFMDDSYLIHHDVEYLKECLEKIRELYAEYGITLNEKKTKICDFRHGFDYLKTRFYITESGKIIKKPCREAVTKERRKLKKQAKLVDKGIMTYEEVRTSYASWRGAMVHKDAYRTIRSMDNLFNKLLIEEWRKTWTTKI